MTGKSNGPAWGYRNGDAKIFEDGVLPDGWVDSPDKVKPAKSVKATKEASADTTAQADNETDAGE